MTGIPFLSATDLLARIRTGSLSRETVMEAFLDRINRVNPAINAVVSLRDDDTLLAEAREADRNPTGGALDGLPIAIKDLQDVAGIRSTSGSPIFADHVPEADSFLVSRIRKAGAIIIGKTNTPEFGLGSHSYNPVHGTTLNPWDRSRSAGGSSGGAAAALAARLVPLADGSDMMGSLRNPAGFCNLVGVRPSFGRVPAGPDGELFLAQLSTDGPMARSVADAALFLDCLAGPDPGFPASLPDERPFVTALDRPVAGKRIGWIGDWNGHYPTDPGMIDLLEEALASFAPLGVAVEKITPDFDPERLWQSWTTLRAFLVAGGLKAHADNPAERAMLKPEALDEIDVANRLSAADIHAASAIRSDWFRTVMALFARYDALILPTAQVFPFPADWAWPKEIAGRKMDRYHRWMEVVIPASLLGLPVVALPAGFNAAGLPAGFQLIGRPRDDAGMLALAHAYDQATHWTEKLPPGLD